MVAAHIMPANYAPLTQPGASLAMLEGKEFAAVNLLDEA
jgi:hypothetical protein